MLQCEAYMDEKLIKRLILASALLLCLAVSAVVLYDLVTDYHGQLWDFSISYHAGKAYAQGLNPYDTKILYQIAGHTSYTIWMPFVYSPPTLWFFRIFSGLHYQTATYLFLSLKGVLLFALIYLWGRAILQRKADLLFILFCFFGFNAAIFADIRTGNISIVEEFLIWVALYFYLKNSRLLFCLFIILAAFFKLTPMIFMALLLFGEREKRYTYLFGSCIIFGAILLASYAASPVLFGGYLHNVVWSAMHGEHGAINPATLPLIVDVFGFLQQRTNLTVPQAIPWAIYFAIAAAIVFVSWRSCTALRSSKDQNKDRVLVFFACVVYALILPRFKDYSYILLLVPTYFIVARVSYTKGFALILLSESVMAVLSAVNIRVSVLNTNVFPLGYYPLVLAYCVWALYLYAMWKSPRTIE